MSAFTVIGIYPDNRQRYATSVEAPDAKTAEAIARAQVRAGSGDPECQLWVAGVIAGCHACADDTHAADAGPGWHVSAT